MKLVQGTVQTHRVMFALAVAVALAIGPVAGARLFADETALRFEISFPAAAHAEPVTGRVYVMISRTDAPEPRLQVGRTGTPFFGRDVEAVVPGQAALIDGCSRLAVLYRIVLPLAAPAIIAVGTFAFLLSWNEFTFAFVFTKSRALTIPVGMRGAFLGQYVNKYDLLFAASLIFSLPPIALFVSLQKYFVQGLTAGAVKQ